MAPRSLQVSVAIADRNVMERKSTPLVRSGRGDGRKSAGSILRVGGYEDHYARQAALGAPVHEAFIDRPQAVLDGRNAMQ